jgi:hypothetical protein
VVVLTTWSATAQRKGVPKVRTPRYSCPPHPPRARATLHSCPRASPLQLRPTLHVPAPPSTAARHPPQLVSCLGHRVYTVLQLPVMGIWRLGPEWGGGGGRRGHVVVAADFPIGPCGEGRQQLTDFARRCRS